MIDYAKITVQAGNGGRGSGSQAQIKGKRYGKADGGDGGRGGDLYFVTTTDLNTLEPYRFLKHYEAENGQNGFSNLRRGASGRDFELKVPVGTVVSVMSPPTSLPSEASAKESPTSQTSLTLDLAQRGERVLIARGGHGGKGNAHLRDEYGRRPRTGEPGQEGEKLDLILELKLIANVGLIGLPNAGKSTLLSKLTSATPKIANYPFTTLEPNLGVLRLSVLSSQLSDNRLSVNQLSDKQKTDKPVSDNRQPKTDKLILADIPGLIEGASQGKGLGDLFLRHIERTMLLVHLIDISSPVIAAPTGNPPSVIATPSGTRGKQSLNQIATSRPFNEKVGTRNDYQQLWGNYQTVRSELKNYSKSLGKKKEIIALNKADLLNTQQIQAAIAIFKNHRKKVLVLSAEIESGLDLLVREIFKKLKP